MKKIILLFFLFFISINLFSQEFYGGVLAGFNGSQVEGDLASGYNKLGLVGGVWIQRDLLPDFYWGMELKYNQKGSRVLASKKNGYWKYVYRLNYIDLPMLVGYRVLPYLSVFTGLSYGYLMNKSGYNNFGDDPSVYYDNTSKWELGMFTGFKVNFEHLVVKEWAKKFMLETRFQYSMLSFDKSHDFFTRYLSIGQFNNVISTVLYYRVEWPETR